MTKRIWIVLGIAAVLRLAGIGYGLPAVFNADEPHVVNVAVSFGAGTLNPHDFKYPTLWMYLLFGSYGIFFAAWSGLGLMHSVRQFGELYVWNPTAFYLIARVLSSAVQIAAIERVYRAGVLLEGEEAGLWAAAFLAVSPVLNVAAHAAKPDSMMFLWAALAWWLAARYWREGEPWDLTLCGLMAGLAASTQFTALPLAALVPAAGWSKRGLRESAVWKGAAAAAVGFFLGSPFVLLDLHRFLHTIQDQRAMEAMGSHAGMWRVVGFNIATFAGSAAPGALFVLGALWLCVNDRRKAALLLVPIVAAWASLSISAEGSWQRYLFAIFPGAAMATGVAAQETLCRGAPSGGLLSRVALAAVLILLMMPGAINCISFDRELLLPDTRASAAAWIEKNISAGTKLLLDQEHASPRVAMALPQVEDMFRRTNAAGNPRRRYYDFMRTGHPGGGYWIYRVLRGPTDLHTNPALAAQSAEGQPTLDVRSGLSAARAAGVEVVVLTSHGAEPRHSPDLKKFLTETSTQAKLLAEFSPEPRKRAGPDIRIYRIH